MPMLLEERDPGQRLTKGKPPRRWRDKFAEAYRGLKLGIRGHSSFFVHFFFAALVVAAAAVFRCSLIQWCILLGCIGMVMTAELFNSAIEALYHGLADEESKRRCKPCLDIAAGAVLAGSGFAAVIGSLIFLQLLAEMVFG